MDGETDRTGVSQQVCQVLRIGEKQELCGMETKCRKRGKDIKAFDSEEQDLIYIDADSALEEQNKRAI
ncbi:hypothetical protein CgunFtcFv8_004139 [Champsocephalus gunnari]|uniref:Uncharacterized protein n=1 Tax=Champsocephalus gunnari TaxID=52237 RepID=A0AAN8HYF3_CHAGU|nr:hypothetical protein CgunFtcFv8_004139 [Champsocephalus gunnari]